MVNTKKIIQELTEVLKKHGETLKQTAGYVNEFVSAYGNLPSGLVKMMQEMAKATTNTTKSQKTLNEVKKETDKLNVEEIKRQKEVAKALGTSQKKLKDLKATKASLNNDLGSVKEEIKLIEKEIRTTDKRSKALKDLQKDEKALHEEHVNSIYEKAEVQNRYYDATKAVSAASQAIVKKEKSLLNELNEKLDDSIDKQKELAKEKASISSKITNTEAEIKELITKREAIGKLTEEHKEYRNELELTKTKLEELKMSRGIAETNVSKAKARIDAIKTEREALGEKSEAYETLGKDLEKAEDSYNDLKDVLEDLADAYNDTNDEKYRLQNDVEDTKDDESKAYRRLTEDIADAREELVEYKEEKAKLNQDSITNSAETESIKAQIENVSELADANGDLAKTSVLAKQKQKELFEVKTAAENRSKEIREDIALTEKLIKQAGKESEAYKKLQEDLKILKHSEEDLGVTLKENKEHIKAATQEIGNYKDELAVMNGEFRPGKYWEALISSIQNVKDKANGISDSFKNGFSAVGGYLVNLKDGFVNASIKAKDSVLGIAESIKSLSVKGVYDSAKQGLGSLKDGFVNTSIQAKESVLGVVDSIRNLSAKDVYDSVKGGLTSLKDGFVNTSKKAVNSIETIVQKIKTINFKDALKGGYHKFQKNLEGIGKKGEDVSAAFNALKGSWNDIKNGFLSGNFIQVAQGLGSIGGNIKNMTKASLSFIATPIGAAIAALSAIGFAVKSWFDFNEAVSAANKEVKEISGESGKAVDQIRIRGEVLKDTFGTDLKDSVSAAKGLVEEFGIGYQEAFDIIEDGAIRGKLSNEEFLGGLDGLSEKYNAAGFSASEFGNLVSSDIDVSVYKDKLPKAFGEFTSAITKESPKAKKALESTLGAEFTNGLFKGIKDGSITSKEALAQVAAETKSIGVNSEQAQVLTSGLFGSSKEDAGLALEMFDAVNVSLNGQKEPLTEIQQLQKEQLDANKELDGIYTQLFATGNGGFKEIIAQGELFVTKTLIKLLKAGVDVYNWFVDLNNQSGAFSAFLRGLGSLATFQFSIMGEGLSLLWEQIKSIGTILEGVFTKDWRKVKEGYKSGLGNIAQSFTNLKDKAISEYEAIKDAFEGGIVAKRITLEDLTGDDKTGGNKTGGSTTNTKTGGGTDKDKETDEETTNTVTPKAREKVEPTIIPVEYSVEVDIEKSITEAKKIKDAFDELKENIPDNVKEFIGDIEVEFAKFQENNEGKYADDFEAFRAFAEQKTAAYQAEMEKHKQVTQEYLNGFSDDFIANSPLSSLGQFFDGTFDDLMKSAEETGTEFAVAFNAIAESAQQAFNFISDISNQRFERELEQLEASKEYQLQFAGDNEAAKAEIERQYEEKRTVIQKRQAKAEKKQAIFNAIINTAQAIVSTLAQEKGGAVKKGIAAAAIGALGVAQIAMIASQPTPQFWQGGIVGGEQQIMVNDDPHGKKGRNYKEVIQKPNGQTLFPQGKNVKMTVPNGTIVHPTYEAFLSSLNANLSDNAIIPIGLPSIAANVQSQGLTKGEVMDVMHQHANSLIKTINSQNGVHINIDENGINKYITKKQSAKKILNARFSGNGRSV